MDHLKFCPCCGNTDLEVKMAVYCPKCLMKGPASTDRVQDFEHVDREWAIKQWNNLPRDNRKCWK